MTDLTKLSDSELYEIIENATNGEDVSEYKEELKRRMDLISEN